MDKQMDISLEDLWLEHNYTEITKRFEKFLARYKDIFSARASTKKVMALSRSATDIWRTLRYLTHSGSPTQVHQMRMSILENIGEEELHQIVYLAFCEVLNKYNPERGVPLEKFIYNYYPYIITAEVNKLAGPKQVLNNPTLLSIFDPDEGDKNNSVATKNFDLSTLSIELDHNWISGDTCGEPFSCLTALERKLLVLVYIEKKTQEEIAQEMRYHFSSIKRKKNSILKKLETRMEELDDEE
jgi:RNA polymerase sigma factor (sigma-70 family)